MTTERPSPISAVLHPLLVVCPRVEQDPDGTPTLKLRTQMNLFSRSPSHINPEPSSGLSVRPEQLTRENDAYFSEYGRSAEWLPPSMVKNYQDWIEGVDNYLRSEGKTIPNAGDRIGWNSDKKRKRVRTITTTLFPQFNHIKGAKLERSLFRGKRIEQYIDEVSLPNAVGFWDWILEQLPEELRQPLELSNAVRTATSVLDLVHIYAKQNHGLSTAAGQHTLYPPKKTELSEQWEAGLILSLMYMATVADLARNPLEDEVLSAFSQEITKSFAEEGDWHLLMDRDKVTGACARLHFASPREKEDLDRQGGQYAQDLTQTARRYAEYAYDVFLYPKARTKTLYSRMFKMWRGRVYPLSDLIGARFVLPDRRYLANFVNTLQKKLTNWVIREEPDKSTGRQAVVFETKYECWLKDFPDHKIELQIQTITDNQKQKGSWIKLEHQPDTNPKAFRVKQLMELLPVMLPEELYGIKWLDKQGKLNMDVFKQLLRYANQSLFD